MVSCIFTFVLSCPVTPALIFLNHLTNRKCLSLHISAPKPPVCPSFAGKYVPEFLPQHPLTQSGLTMPSCYGIACLAKRHSSGSGWQITKHENKSCNPADFGSSCSACILILDRFGKVRQTETETQVDFFFLLFLQETHSSCTVPWFSSVYNLSISVSKNAELTSSAPLDRNLQRSRKLFFFFSRPLSCRSPWPLTLPCNARSPRTLTKAGFLELFRWLTCMRAVPGL